MNDIPKEKKKSPFIEHFKTFLIIILGYNSIGGLVNSAFDGAIVWVGFFADINEVYVDARQTYIEPLLRWISIDLKPKVGDYVVLISISFRAFLTFISAMGMKKKVLNNEVRLSSEPEWFQQFMMLSYTFFVLLFAPFLFFSMPFVFLLIIVLEYRKEGKIMHNILNGVEVIIGVYKPLLWFFVILFCNYLYKMWIFERYVNS